MEIIKPKGNRIAVQKIKKITLLTSAAEQNYDYEKYKYKVVAVGETVEDKELIGKVIVKQPTTGVTVEFEGQEYIIIREEDILAIA